MFFFFYRVESSKGFVLAGLVFFDMGKTFRHFDLLIIYDWTAFSRCRPFPSQPHVPHNLILIFKKRFLHGVAICPPSSAKKNSVERGPVDSFSLRSSSFSLVTAIFKDLARGMKPWMIRWPINRCWRPRQRLDGELRKSCASCDWSPARWPCRQVERNQLVASYSRMNCCCVPTAASSSVQLVNKKKDAVFVVPDSHPSGMVFPSSRWISLSLYLLLLLLFRTNEAANRFPLGGGFFNLHYFTRDFLPSSTFQNGHETATRSLLSSGHHVTRLWRENQTKVDYIYRVIMIFSPSPQRVVARQS